MRHDYQFGVTLTSGRMSREWRQFRAKVASKNQCVFFEYREPGDRGYRYWFATENAGAPALERVMSSVFTELAGK